MKGFLIGLRLRLGVWWFGVWRGIYVVLMVCMWHGSDRRICRSFHYTLFHSHLYTYTHTPTPHPPSPSWGSPTPSSYISILAPVHLQTSF